MDFADSIYISFSLSLFGPKRVNFEMDVVFLNLQLTSAAKLYDNVSVM